MADARRGARWRIVVGPFAVLLAACSSGSYTDHAVPDPPGARVVRTIPDGPRAWALVQDGRCVRLRISARGRRFLSDPECRWAPFSTDVRVTEETFSFNDRDVERTRCPDDCAARRPDVTMSAPVAWGLVGPHVGFVCVAGPSGPIVIRPDAQGRVLAPVQGAGPAASDVDGALPFLPDGRFAGAIDDTRPPAPVEACRTAGAPGRTPAPSSSWPLRIVVPSGVTTNEDGTDVSLSLLTDTGYLPEGASLSVLAQGYRIPLRLDPDTTAMVVVLDGAPQRTTVFPLPPLVVHVLTGAQPCGWRPTLILRIDARLRPQLSLDDDGKACRPT